MKKKMLKKSDVLREGYIKGLKEAQRAINESYTMNEMGALITQDLIDYLEKVKTAFEDERGKEAKNIKINWWGVNNEYENLKGYMRKVFGLR